MLEKINVNQITQITIFDKKVFPYYKWKNKTTFFGLTINKEGYYSNVFKPKPNDKAMIDMDYLVIDKVVYVKPRICISLSDKTHHSIYFDTMDELNTYYTNNIKPLNLKLIEL